MSFKSEFTVSCVFLRASRGFEISPTPKFPPHQKRPFPKSKLIGTGGSAGKKKAFPKSKSRDFAMSRFADYPAHGRAVACRA